VVDSSASADVGHSAQSRLRRSPAGTIVERAWAVRVYLDTSVYNRPFDDQTQPRIWLETLALVLILQMIEAGETVATLVEKIHRYQGKPQQP